jgi:hypothetical protein
LVVAALNLAISFFLAYASQETFLAFPVGKKEWKPSDESKLT